MMIKFFRNIAGIFIVFISSCNGVVTPDEEMKALLNKINKSQYSAENKYCPGAIIAACDVIINESNDRAKILEARITKANALLEDGDERNAIGLFKAVLKEPGIQDRLNIKRSLAIAFLRLGEKNNCLHNHSGESCVFPISGAGIHTDASGSLQAVKLYQEILQEDISDLESKWLLNIGYMTLGKYPGSVPEAHLIKGLDADSSYKIKPFRDLAMKLGLDTRDLGGGNITEDFNNDGYLDIVTSSWSLDEGMHYFKNNGNGSFADLSVSSGLREVKGGINIMQTDYNNDGLKDIFVLRGGWKGVFGKEPPSLLKNNGNGTFSDVTKACGLPFLYPTQTATWADFNNDGWLDVFIGYESQDSPGTACRLYMNNRGIFTEISATAGCNLVSFVKGVTSGDYNNDGFVDLFISALDGPRLLKNNGLKGGSVHFTDVTQQAGIINAHMRTFATWFWDYNNDGWLDILACDYEFKTPLAAYAAMDAIYNNTGKGGKLYLLKNDQHGGFTDVSAEAGLTRMVYAMGANFGDIDNDGYPDMYFGSGNPLYQSLIPNKMFKNIDGKTFADVTKSARVGNLQKGHGVSFADLDNDGNQDIYIEMGGAFKGDAYQNALYLNPGQSDNRWISLSLEGVRSNRLAIGARVKVSFSENGKARHVFKEVNSGGSFGSNPLRQHIGIGKAVLIDSLVVTWPGSNCSPIFKNIQPGQFLSLEEGSDHLTITGTRKIDFLNGSSSPILCAPPLK